MVEEKQISKREVRRLIRRSGRRPARRSSSRNLASRTRKFSNVSKAFGALPGGASGSGAGRPKGSFKYRINGKPVSVFAWRKFQAQRKRQLSQFQSQQNQRLASKGFQPEQIQQLRRERVIQRVQRGKPVMENNIADEELGFKKHLAQNTVSPTTQQILVALRRTQNKARSDNIDQQRRHHEKNLVGRAMNLMEAHKNLVPVRLDFTGVDPDENILMAKSVFKEDPRNNILRPRGRNILNTEEFTLKF